MKKLMMAVAVCVCALGAMAYTYTSESYVQDGLIAQWDGIDNVLLDGVRLHDANAEVWSDLTGNGNDFAVGSYWGTQLDSWTDTSLKAKSCYCVPCNKSCSDYVTIEICAKHNQMYQCLFNSGDGLKKFIAVKNNSVQFYNAANMNYDIGKAAFFQAAAVHSPTVSSPVVYTNGVPTARTSTDSWGGNSVGTCLGRGANNYQFTGEYYAIRLYNRALTPEELAQNAKIDVKRFVDKDIYGDNGVLVVGEPQNYALADSPSYGFIEKAVGDQVEMTAPDYVELADGKRKRCGGWRLYDRETHELVAESTDATRLTCAFEFEKPVRLVWLWNVLRVPGCYATIADAVAEAQSGDEIVVAAGTYLVSARLTVPSGVTLRGATGDFNDVIIAGGTAESATSSLVSGAVTVSQNATMRDLTIAHFKDSGVTATAWKSDQHIINCRITDVRATGDWNGTALAFQTKGSIENCVIDNCVVGPQQNGVFLFASTAVVDGCVITNNSVTMKTANATTMPPIVATTSGSTAIIKNSFIGFNKCGVVRPAKSAIASSTAWGVISMESGTFDNCVIAGNEFQGKLPYGICAIRRVGGTVKNTVIVENGMGADNVWTKSGTASNFKNCLTTGTDGMQDSVEAQATDLFVKEGGLPWLPYGSRAIGAGSDGGDIGRIWTPATLQCGIKRDKRTYLVGETANLTAVASDEATFAWELVAGDATLTDNGATATLLFNSASTAKVKLTANGLASDEIELEAGLKTFDVASDAELEAAVDAAFDGAEIVLAEGDYAPTKTLVLKTAVTVRGATGDRDDVTVSGSNARRVFTIDHPGAVISSLTIKNGKSSFAGGVFMETGGMLTNVAVYGCSGTSYNGSYDSSSNNDAQWYTACGGVVCNYEGTVVDCDFSNSKRTVYYNSPGFYAQIGPDAVADRLIVTNNENTAKDTSKYLTAPVAITGGGTIRNAFVAYNDANYSGSTTYDDACGVFVDSGRLENSTVFRNVMAAADAARMPGIRLKKTTSYAVNCISVENAGKNGGATSNWAAADASLLTYCATTPVDGLDGTCVSFTGEPYELDAAGYPVSKSNSPTIDKGDDSLEWVFPGLDLYRAARLQGEHVDIGAVEYVPPTFAVSLSVLPDVYEGLDRVEALLTAVPDGDLEGVSAEWDLDGDGIYETKTGTTLTQNLVITRFGTTCVSVHVTNTAGNEAFDHKDFTVNPSVVYVDPANTSGAAAPYATEETAATNIQDAVDVAGNGATVKIARGTYELAYPVVVKKPIAVEGVVGDIAAVTLTPQDIKVNGSLFVLNATGASVSYLTLKGARANRSFAPLGGVGASLNNTGANVIRFCRFTDFSDGDGWALPAGVRNDGGQVLDCTFDSQYDQGDACNPAVYWQSGAAALIDRCTIIGIRATSMCCQGANSRSTFVYIEGGTARNVLVGKCAVSTGKYTKENVPGQSYSNLAVPATFIYAKSGLIENCSVVDCTLASKSTDRLAAIKHDSAGVVRNCFAGGNVCTVQPDGGESTVYEMDFYSTGYDYCCGKDANVFGADHEGNVELVSGTWRWRANGQLRMKNASPCTNAGLYDATWMPSATDVYGSPRMVREDKVDIGAVLCREPGLMLLLK